MYWSVQHAYHWSVDSWRVYHLSKLACRIGQSTILVLPNWAVSGHEQLCQRGGSDTIHSRKDRFDKRPQFLPLTGQTTDLKKKENKENELNIVENSKGRERPNSFLVQARLFGCSSLVRVHGSFSTNIWRLVELGRFQKATKRGKWKNGRSSWPNLGSNETAFCKRSKHFIDINNQIVMVIQRKKKYNPTEV